MSADPATWTDGMRAVHRYAGVLWDAHAAMVDAYVVDTGDTRPAITRRWADLSYEHQLAFMVATQSAVGQIIDAQSRVHQLATGGVS